MDKVRVHIEEVFRFNCPECDHFEELDEEPDTYSEVWICEGCGATFELEVQR